MGVRLKGGAKSKDDRVKIHNTYGLGLDEWAINFFVFRENPK